MCSTRREPRHNGVPFSNQFDNIKAPIWERRENIGDPSANAFAPDRLVEILGVLCEILNISIYCRRGSALRDSVESLPRFAFRHRVFRRLWKHSLALKRRTRFLMQE